MISEGARQTAGPTAPDAGPQQWHRGMTLVATISLFIGTRAAWTTAMGSRPAVAAVISVCYASILVCAVLSLLVWDLRDRQSGRDHPVTVAAAHRVRARREREAGRATVRRSCKINLAKRLVVEVGCWDKHLGTPGSEETNG